MLEWLVRHRSRATYSRQPRQVRKEATVTGSCVCSEPPVPGFVFGSSRNMPADFNNQVRVRLYEMFVELGRCPSKSALAANLGCGVPEITDAFNALAAVHMLVLQPGGEVLMANPLSAVPTPFVVETESPAGPRRWYGNCIWDALGVVAMLHGDGRVLTSCGCCGESMTVSVRAAEPTCEPAGLVHFALPARQWWNDIVFN